MADDWWYLSFCDPKAPRGTQFLSACFVRGRTNRDAFQNASNLGCNPGPHAEVISSGPYVHEYIMGKVPVNYRERPLTKEIMVHQLGWALESIFRGPEKRAWS
jgi:hypothetical protein